MISVRKPPSKKKRTLKILKKLLHGRFSCEMGKALLKNIGKGFLLLKNSIKTGHFLAKLLAVEFATLLHQNFV